MCFPLPPLLGVLLVQSHAIVFCSYIWGVGRRHRFAQSFTFCWSRKCPYSPHRREYQIPFGWRGEGSQRPKAMKKSMRLNWNFQRGGGSLGKIPGASNKMIHRASKTMVKLACLGNQIFCFCRTRNSRLFGINL